MTQRVDAAVVGGGPAGAIAARLLAVAGWSVMLIERGAIGRNKICGHCLSPRALPMLRRINLLDRIVSIARGQTHTLRIHAGPGRPLRVPLPKSRARTGVLVRRAEFDRLLCEAAREAGASLVQPALARFRSIDDHGFVLDVEGDGRRQSVSGRLLIGADGVGSGVARAAGLADRTSAGRKYGFAFDVSAPPPDEGRFEPGVIEMFLGAGGYVGAVHECEDLLHVASLVGRSAGTSRDPGRFLRQLEREHSGLLPRGLCGVDPLPGGFGAIGPMPWRPRTVASGPVALVGDAAGYAEPFTGEGMTWAIESAMLLAQAIRTNDGRWSTDAAHAYRQEWHRAIGRRQERCGLIARGLERPRMTQLAVHLGRAAPCIAARLARGVVGA